MIDMKLKFADTLKPDQLMIEDLIAINDEVVEVIDIDSDATGTIYAVGFRNEFGEKDVAEFNFTDNVLLYVYVDDDE